MTGSWVVEVKAVRPFTIHGDIYWELTVVRDEDAGTGILLRVPLHAARAEPMAGQRLSVTFLMGQVTGVKAVE
jgi:hypothetical protein